MIVWTCQCGYTWVINLCTAQLIGPIYSSRVIPEDSIFVGNQRKEIPMEEFRDRYGDCYMQFIKRLLEDTV